MKEKLQELRKKTNQSGLWLTTLFYLLLIGIFVFAHNLTALNILWLLPIMGWVQYYVVISGHEAVHRTLTPNPVLNEFLGVFGQALVGVNFTAYRLQHFDHHRVTDFHNDPDSHIYYGVITKKAGLQRFLWLTLGTFWEIIVKIHQKGSGGYGTERDIKPKIQRNMKRDSLLVIVTQVSLMGICYWSIGGVDFLHVFCESLFQNIPLAGWMVLAVDIVSSYILLWIVPLFAFTVFLNRCRIVIEHGLALQMVDQMEDFAGLRIPTVEILPNVVERWIFAPYQFNFHCSHHCYMAVPHYNLKELHNVLKSRQNPGFLYVEGGYIQALWKVIHHPKTEFALPKQGMDPAQITE